MDEPSLRYSFVDWGLDWNDLKCLFQKYNFYVLSSSFITDNNRETVGECLSLFMSFLSFTPYLDLINFSVVSWKCFLNSSFGTWPLMLGLPHQTVSTLNLLIWGILKLPLSRMVLCTEEWGMECGLVMGGGGKEVGKLHFRKYETRKVLVSS